MAILDLMRSPAELAPTTPGNIFLWLKPTLLADMQ